MTLILTRASKNYVLQVTDRLVTRGQQPFDEPANKNVVYCARTGIVTMGYTGHAFLGDVPTDQWIVETLMGHTFERARKPPALTYVQVRSLDLGRALNLLKEALDNAPVAAKWRADWFAKSFDVCVAGWQWRRNGYRPVFAGLGKPAHRATFELGYEPRYWFCGGASPATGPGRRLTVKVGAAPAENIPNEELQKLVARLADKRSDEAEGILVDAIRAVSTRVPQVGPHCVSIVLAPPRVGFARVRYLPLRGHGQANLVVSSGSRLTIPVAYSPWVVGPNVIAAPSVISGGSIGLGLYTVHIEGPPGFPQVWSGLARRKAP